MSRIGSFKLKLQLFLSAFVSKLSTLCYRHVYCNVKIYVLVDKTKKSKVFFLSFTAKNSESKTASKSHRYLAG